MVNAPVIARERNIAVTEVKHDRSVDYQTLIRITIEAEDRTRRIAGTLIADKPRIVEIDQIAIEAEFFPHVLYIRNQDKPGFVGNLGRTLGEAGINIATFHMGRIAPGGDAICLILADQPVTDMVLASVCALPHVVRVKSLRF
jgi:D-3-phosphoglycerate dehydrogenase